MTVRGVFYQLEATGVVEKTEGGYRQVQKQVLRMREEGLLDWAFITDGTRLQRKPRSYTDAGEYIDRVALTYRRNLWQSQNVRLEFWLEKDALADLVFDVTREWDVSLMVSRGQSSATFLYSAGKEAERAWQRAGIETYIYTLYDFDDGGRRAARTIGRDLPKFAPDGPIHIEHLAVTERQIAEWSLPTRPAKKSDPEAGKSGTNVAVELDAIDPAHLTRLVEDTILEHVDPHAWATEEAIETEEKAGLRALAVGWRQ